MAAAATPNTPKKEETEKWWYGVWWIAAAIIGLLLIGGLYQKYKTPIRESGQGGMTTRSGEGSNTTQTTEPSHPGKETIVLKPSETREVALGMGKKEITCVNEQAVHKVFSLEGDEVFRGYTGCNQSFDKAVFTNKTASPQKVIIVRP